MLDFPGGATSTGYERKRNAVAENADEPDAACANADEAQDEEAKRADSRTITELLVELGRDVSVLVFCETQLAAYRNLPEVRRTARDIAGALVAALAFLTAFVLANIAALDGLTHVISLWLAALVLSAVWLALAIVVVLALMVRAGHVSGWSWWRVFRAGPEKSLEDLERARAGAEEAVRDTLERLAPAMTGVEIASASVGVAGDMAGDVVAAGADLLETSDEVVDVRLRESVPGGSVVSQVWDVVLTPGRIGAKVATTVFRRGESRG